MYKNGVSKTYKFDDKDLPTFVTKKWIEVYDQSKKITVLTKKLELKHQC